MGFWRTRVGNAPKCMIIDGPIIVGGGPSGLAVSACLKEKGVPSVILERSNCLASLWQQKSYDRLKLHLPKQYCELPMLGFPKDFPKYPSKNQFISYLVSYAEHFKIQPLFNQGVERAEYDQRVGMWRVRTQDREFVSPWLIVASGENADPFTPEIAGIERFGGSVVHTSAYKSGGAYVGQRVLVVGCGNSGMEVSVDLCSYNARPHLVARNNVHILPREMFGFSTFGMSMALLKWLPLKLVDQLLILGANLTFGNTDSLGLQRPKPGPLEVKNVTGKTPVLDVGAMSLIKSGKIKVVKDVMEITKHGAKFINEEEEEFDSIILATGYKSNVPCWLKGQGSDFFTDKGLPKIPFPRGWKGEKGLYTVGFTQKGLLGVKSDSVNVARDIAAQWNRSGPALVNGNSPASKNRQNKSKRAKRGKRM